MLGNWTENDMANIEKIEVIKGPSSTLFGSHSRTNYGGVINRVTKKPYNKFGGNISLTSGSNAYNRLTADVNTPLDKDGKLLARINTAYRKEGSFQDYGWAESIFVAPSITYQANDKLKFIMEADIFTITGSNRAGLNIQKDITNINEINDIYNLSFTTDEFTFDKKSMIFSASAVYQINNQWTSTSSYAYSHSDYDNQSPYVFIGEDNMASRNLNFQTYDYDFTSLQQNFNGDFKIGNMRNRLLLGVDYLREQGKWAGGTSVGYDSFNYTERAPYISANNASTAFGTVTPWNDGFINDRYGIYAANVLDITTNLHLMTSLRFDYTDVKFNDLILVNTLDEEYSYTQGSWAPKLGLVYEIIPENLSVFGNYMQGVQNVNTLTIDDGSDVGEITSGVPERATQWEMGVKSNLFDDKLSVTISYFDIKVDNIVRTDPNNTQFEVQDGAQKNKGIEIEILAQPTPGLYIMFGYANLDAMFLNGSQEGNRPGYTPKNTFNYWFNYKLMNSKYKGLGIGLGGNYRADSYYSSDNEITLPSTHIVNTALFYDQPKYRISLKVDNLTNKKDWGSGSFAQNTRNISGALIFKF
jgi:iron complex outermembrane receptor protein